MEGTHSQGKGAMIVGLGLLVVLGASPLALAEVGCGSTIGPNQAAVLTEDLTCPGSDPALTVKGPAVLRMNGKMISCAGSGFNGIEVIGKQAVIQGAGTVKRCRNGVVLLDKGKHVIKGVKATRNDESGFLVEEGSNRNTLSDNTALKNGGDFIQDDDDGFHVNSNENELSYNTSKKNNDDGFDTDGGVNRNTFKENLAQENGDDGFDLDGGASSLKNEFSGNVSNLNGDDGFDLDGDQTKVVGNTANKNGDGGPGEEGFDVGGDDVQVISNTSHGNLSHGFEVEEGARYTVVGNTSTKNGGRGIELEEDAVDSLIFRNSAKNNTLDDLADENFVPPCDNNRWLANIFTTKNQFCVQ